MTFLTIMGVTEMLCSFRLVLQGKAGKEIPESSRLGVLEKFLVDTVDLSDAEDNTLGLLNREGIVFSVENAISNLPKVTRAKILRSDVLSCFISICKFGSSKNNFATITGLLACLNFTLNSEDLLCWYKRKK